MTMSTESISIENVADIRAITGSEPASESSGLFKSELTRFEQVASEILGDAEHEDETLEQLETKIESGLASFVEVGMALKKINEGRLYKGVATDFDNYCLERWQMSGSHAHRLIRAAECWQVLKEHAHQFGETHFLPTYESQIRPIASLKADKWAAEWKKVVDQSEGKRVTAEFVSQVLLDAPKRKTLGKRQGKKTTKPNSELRKIVTWVKKIRKKITAEDTEVTKLLDKIEKLVTSQLQAA